MEVLIDHYLESIGLKDSVIYNMNNIHNPRIDLKAIIRDFLLQSEIKVVIVEKKDNISFKIHNPRIDYVKEINIKDCHIPGKSKYHK